MKNHSYKTPVLLFLACIFIGAAGTRAVPQKVVVRGWLSDEDCAKNRAANGTYTATGLTCTKECIAKGKKIALIDPQGKRVLVLANQEIAKKNVGDFVEIKGEIDAQSGMLRADSLKFLDKNRAMCEVPAKKAAAAEPQ